MEQELEIISLFLPSHNIHTIYQLAFIIKIKHHDIHSEETTYCWLSDKDYQFYNKFLLSKLIVFFRTNGVSVVKIATCISKCFNCRSSIREFHHFAIPPIINTYYLV